MKTVLKADVNGHVVVPTGAVSRQTNCARCGKQVNKDSICFYADYGWNKKVLKVAGCNACVQAD